MNSVMDSMEGFEDLYLTEDDPELVRESMPSNLKMLELLINQSPEDPRLLLSAAQAFTMYGHAFIQRDAEIMMSHNNLDEATRLRERSKKLFSRAKGYAFRALESTYPGFWESYSTDPEETLRKIGENDVPLLYWTTASWGSLISISKDDPAAIIELPNIGYFLDRALELDESYDKGALHEIMISYSISRADAGSSALEEAKRHFERALNLSEGKRASVYIAYAEAVSVRNQDKDEFISMLERALSIDINENPSSRLANIIAQERAQWLMERVDELFF